jgi:hypothetical protein
MGDTPLAQKITTSALNYLNTYILLQHNPDPHSHSLLLTQKHETLLLLLQRQGHPAPWAALEDAQISSFLPKTKGFEPYSNAKKKQNPTSFKANSPSYSPTYNPSYTPPRLSHFQPSTSFTLPYSYTHSTHILQPPPPAAKSFKNPPSACYTCGRNHWVHECPNCKKP